MRGMLAVLVLASVTGPVQAQLYLVRGGKPQAQIVIADDATAQVRAAATTLAEYLRQATGATLPVRGEAAAGDAGQLVLVGQTKRWPVSFPDGFAADGFIIAAKGRGISICGPTAWGTEFGVYDFLERYVGVRWLLPGDIGDDVPPATAIAVPEGRVAGQPAFYSRAASGFVTVEAGIWARRQRQHGQVSFHHNLWSLFAPAKYTVTHPEFFPMKDGKTRYLPGADEVCGWEPCFTAPGLADEAIRSICQYFKDHPADTSYSLGTNDDSGFCRCPACLARTDTGRKNFLGLTDFSNLYYDWCNRVVEGVLRQYPDKWFGTLAYSEVAAAPTKVRLNSRLIPFLTHDRMSWIRPDIERAGHQTTESWEQAGDRIGWYDYLYGAPYCLPRVYLHQWQQTLQYGRRHRAQAQYAELYPNWGEGPKAYAIMKLWWNPDLDLDGLLKDWYERCVGPSAAPELARYYDLWERFWTLRMRDSRWLSGGTYLRYETPSYLAEVQPDDLAESQRLLQAALAKSETPAQRARATVLLRAFEYYQASAVAYLAHVETPAMPTTEAIALQTLAHHAEALALADRRRVLALEVFPSDPLLAHPIPITDPHSDLRGQTWATGGLWAIADWVANKEGAVRRQVERLAVSPTGLVARQAGWLLQVADGGVKPLTSNSSFEDGQGASAPPWNWWISRGDGAEGGTMLRTLERARSGRASVLCDHVARGGPCCIVPFAGAGRYLARAWVYLPEDQPFTQGTLELMLTARDSERRPLRVLSTKTRVQPGQWRLVVVQHDLTETISNETVSTLLLVPTLEGFERSRLYLDDVTLFRLP
jgi:hypothetical protein